MVGIIFSAMAFMVTLAKMEITYSFFENFNAADVSIKAGWIPKWIPASSYNIEESHDIDSNVSWIKFTYYNFGESELSQCVLGSVSDMKIPERRYIRRFPRFVTEMVDLMKSMDQLEFYICDNGNSYLVIYREENTAFSWNLGDR